MANPNTGDGKFVAVQDGKRVSGLKDTQQEAAAEAEKLGKVNENQAVTPAPPVQIKQHLCG